MGKIKDLLNKIWPWFQPTYDQIKKWDFPEPVKELLDEVWDLLDDNIKKAIFEFIQSLVTKYGKEFAAQLLEKILKQLKARVA